MTVRQVVVDDHDGTDIPPGALQIHASWSINGGGVPSATGEGDFASFDSLIAYVQAQQAKLQPPAPAPAPAPVTP